MKLTVVTRTEIDAPDDATHVDPDEDVDLLVFYKMTNVGVVGEHWWRWKQREWVFVSHRKPPRVIEIPEEWRD